MHRLGVIALLALAMLVVYAGPAAADPGAPGLDRPATSVYSQGDERPVLGEETGGGGGDGGGDAGQAGANVGGGGGTDQSLPFTGFAAALVLGAGLAMLLLGVAMRAGSVRLRHAGS